MTNYHKQIESSYQYNTLKCLLTKNLSVVFFRSMITYKPKLEAFLDENDEDFDIRELSNNLTKSFPWPIGIELRRLLSGNMERLDRADLTSCLKP